VFWNTTGVGSNFDIAVHHDAEGILVAVLPRQHRPSKEETYVAQTIRRMGSRGARQTVSDLDGLQP